MFWGGAGKGGDLTLALPESLLGRDREFLVLYVLLGVFLVLFNAVPLVTLYHEAFTLPIHSGPALDALGAGASSCWAGSWGDAEALL